MIAALRNLKLPVLRWPGSLDAQGALHLTVVHLDPNRPADVALKVSGAAPKRASGRTLTAPSMTALNGLGAAPSVQPAPFTGAQRQGDRIRLSLPPESVTVPALE